MRVSGIKSLTPPVVRTVDVNCDGESESAVELHVVVSTATLMAIQRAVDATERRRLAAELGLALLTEARSSRSVSEQTG